MLTNTSSNKIYTTMNLINKIRYYGTEKLLLRLAALAVLLIPSTAFAQRGEKTLGVAGGYAGYNNSGLASVYFQYGFTDHVRIAPEVGCAFRHDGKSGFFINADMQFPFKVAKGISLYPLAGLTVNSWSKVGNNTLNRAGLNFGGGVEMYLTSSLKLSLQGKYSLMKTTSGAYASLGIGYVF